MNRVGRVGIGEERLAVQKQVGPANADNADGIERIECYAYHYHTTTNYYCTTALLYDYYYTTIPQLYDYSTTLLLYRAPADADVTDGLECVERHGVPAAAAAAASAAADGRHRRRRNRGGRLGRRLNGGRGGVRV